MEPAAAAAAAPSTSPSYSAAARVNSGVAAAPEAPPISSRHFPVDFCGQTAPPPPNLKFCWRAQLGNLWRESNADWAIPPDQQQRLNR